MLFDAQLFTTGTLLSSGLLFAFVMWRALAGAPWWQLYQPGRLHLFLGSVLGIAVLWSLSAGISPGLSLHYGDLTDAGNLVRLVQAFAPVAAQQPALRLVLAGKKGWMYEEIFAQVRQLGLEG